jgi:hypothetical protein
MVCYHLIIPKRVCSQDDFSIDNEQISIQIQRQSYSCWYISRIAKGQAQQGRAEQRYCFRYSSWWANWNNNFIEPVRDTFWRTPSHKIAELEKYSLFHYGSTTPHYCTMIVLVVRLALLLLGSLSIVYAFINRHYILDLVPEISVVRNLLKQGFDIYATDWQSVTTKI